MNIMFAVLFTIFCWIAGIQFINIFKIDKHQYRTFKQNLKCYILFWSVVLVLFIGLPILWIFHVM